LLKKEEPMKETVAESIGKFVYRLSYEALPKEIVEKAKTCMINGIGIGISCYDIEFAKIARETIKAEESGLNKKRSATIFCDGSKVTVMGAAFANAGLFHGRAQEDTLGSSHTGTVITPAALAIAEIGGNSGKEVIEAIAAGYEVVGAFDREVSAYTTPRGFRASPAFGIFGSASAASKLLKVSEEETIHAVGFAAAFASGTLECFAAGTMEWRFEVGVASREGILASLIAKNGGKAAATAIEGRTGFLNAFANTADMAEKITAHLGKKWEVMNEGFKPYPVCAFNQTPVIAMLDLVKEQKFNSDQIDRIRIRVNPYEYAYAGMNYRGPFSTIGATLMSTPFCIAAACVDKKVTLKGISQFKNRKILGLIERIEHLPDEKIPRFSCIIEVEMKGGKRFGKEMIVPPDYYNFDMGRDIELIKRVTSETGVDQSKVDRMIELIRNFEKEKNVKKLVEVLAHCP
jgi:2-methylcitrate dehydratase PrpD